MAESGHCDQLKAGWALGPLMRVQNVHHGKIPSSPSNNKMYEQITRSKFRSSFKLDSKDRELITRIGLVKLESHAKELITKRLAPKFPFKDSRQTPYKGHPVFKAQHATATCCRSCLMKWHKMPKHKQLTEEEIDYVIKVIMEWITLKHKFF